KRRSKNQNHEQQSDRGRSPTAARAQILPRGLNFTSPLKHAATIATRLIFEIAIRHETLVRTELSLEWEPNRNLQSSFGILRTRVDVASILDTYGTNDRLPADPQTGGIKSLVERIVFDASRFTECVKENHERKVSRQ